MDLLLNSASRWALQAKGFLGRVGDRIEGWRWKGGDPLVGVQGHGCAVKLVLGANVKACNTVMDICVKCRMLGEARQVFEEMEEWSVVSWTMILDGVVKCEGVGNGMVVFNRMLDRNEVAWIIMIVAYVESGFI